MIEIHLRFSGLKIKNAVFIQLLNFTSKVKMNLSTRFSKIVIASAIVAMLLIPAGIINQTSAFHSGADPHHHFTNLKIPETPNYVEDTIGDTKIRAVFNFNLLGKEVVDSFRIFDQLEGYQKGDVVMFQLLGGVGPDKQKLYTTTDKAYSLKESGRTASTDYFDFEVDIYLFKRGDEIAFRHLMYQSCDVKDYSVITLHDGDETFSGKTKFTIADAFTFVCTGYNPHCPLCIQGEQSLGKGTSEQISSSDLPESMKTWEDWFK